MFKLDAFFFYLHIIAPIYFYSQLISYYTWPILSWLLWCYKRTEYITYQKEEKKKKQQHK